MIDETLLKELRTAEAQEPAEENETRSLLRQYLRALPRSYGDGLCLLRSPDLHVGGRRLPAEKGRTAFFKPGLPLPVLRHGAPGYGGELSHPSGIFQSAPAPY